MIDHLSIQRALRSKALTLSVVSTTAFSRASTATYTDINGVVQTAGVNVLRTASATGTPRINYILFSEQFDNAVWTKGNATVTPDATTAPDGTVSADTLVESTTPTVSHFLQQSVVLIPSTQYTKSVYAKPAGRNWIILQIKDLAGTFRNAYFDVLNGVVGTVSVGITAVITPAANGFFRCAISFASGVGAAAPNEGIFTATANNVSTYTGDGVSGVHFWGAQTEIAAAMTTYLATTSAIVARYDTVGTLVEGAATNAIIWSRDVTQAAGWTLAAQTAQNAVGLDGTPNSATTLTDSSAVAFQNRNSLNITIPNDAATHVAQIWIAKDSDQTRFPQIKFLLQGGTVVQRGISLNTQTGAFAQANVVGGGSATVTDVGLWWLLTITVVNNSSGNTLAQVQLYPAARTVLAGSDNSAATGSCVVGQVQVELNASVGTSPIFTTTAAVTRAADIDQMFAATATGYSRQIGSFVTEGFAQGMEITPAGFGSNVADTITDVSALNLTTKSAKTVDAAVAGRSISVGLPLARAWENKEPATDPPSQGKPYVVEHYLPGSPAVQKTVGPLGDLEVLPLYALHVHVPADYGIDATSRYADAIMRLFTPRTAMAVGSDVLRVSGVSRGQLLQSSPGFAVVPVTATLWLRTPNSI